MINEFNLIENIDIFFDSKVILYGAGFYGMRLYQVLKGERIDLSFFCDSNPEKWGKEFVGVKAISPEELKELDESEDIAIVISAQDSYTVEIMDNIEKLNLRTKKVLTMLGLEILFAQNVNNPRISDRYREFLYQTGEFQKKASQYSRNYNTIKRSAYNFSSTNGILIYQPGKVGSSTVKNSLSAIGYEYCHFHWLKHIPHVPELKGLFEYYLSEFMKVKSTKIICLVREPLIRDYSECFQLLSTYGAYFVMSLGDSFIDAFVRHMENDAFEQSNNYGYQFNWFDNELKAVFGVDVFAHPFDKEKGYTIIKQGSIEVLLIKLERLNTLEAVIGEFVGAPQLKLANANESSGKSIKNLYRNVRKAIKIPRELVDVYYKNNPRMDHFYSEDEKTGFLKKWEDNIID